MNEFLRNLAGILLAFLAYGGMLTVGLYLILRGPHSAKVLALITVVIAILSAIVTTIHPHF